MVKKLFALGSLLAAGILLVLAMVFGMAAAVVGCGSGSSASTTVSTKK